MLAEGKKAHWELEEGIAAISKYFGDRSLCGYLKGRKGEEAWASG